MELAKESKRSFYVSFILSEGLHCQNILSHIKKHYTFLFVFKTEIISFCKWQHIPLISPKFQNFSSKLTPVLHWSCWPKSCWPFVEKQAWRYWIQDGDSYRACSSINYWIPFFTWNKNLITDIYISNKICSPINFYN